MLRKALATGLAFSAASLAFGGVSLSAVAVDAGANPLGANFHTADVLIDVAPASDWWTVGGLSGGPVDASTAQYFISDPNDASVPIMTAPGTASASTTHTTFVSLPRDAAAAKRFGANGAADIAGGYLPPSPTATLDASGANIAYLQFPPSADGLDVPDTGAIARVTIEDLVGGREIVISSSGAPAGFPVLLAEYNLASGTKEDPAPLATLVFGFYTVPEPASLALLALGGLMAIRRR